MILIQFRRGTDAQRQTITPNTGEGFYTTDKKQWWIGDGVTAGGNLVGGGGYSPPLLAGTIAIGNAADSVVVGGLDLPSVPLQVMVTVRKLTGAFNLFATVRGDSITTAGFTADLSAATDSANYHLDYLIVL